ncbi:class I SAM-dependent methyltransferase [Actinoplanes sp. CA-142083]|uniref:class I SAM-dependent methyltransferase n=1 Tax=Actinoplanes sp. CA-142083 TaxID=3239903 RepID=UPI003D8B0042
MSAGFFEYYGVDGVEDTRLRRSPHGRLEFLRTQELLRRHLPPGRHRILDVGGATGIHAAWLAADGNDVHVVDPVPAHVAAAAALPGVTASEGDARTLAAPDASADVVLLFGPLYHLTAASDRAQALAEAVRVLRPGGLLAAAGISRHLSLLENGTNGQLTAADEPPIRQVIETGDYDGHVGFLASHFHTADELRTEVEAAISQDVTVYGVEGPAWPALDVAGLDAFDTLVDSALRCARIAERDPLLINASAHFLAIAHA